MTYALLTLHFEPRLALVQMNRPVARNALSQALMRELIALARDLVERTLAMPAAAVCMSKETVNAAATAATGTPKMPDDTVITIQVIDDTWHGGPRTDERRFVAPFARANRETDYWLAWRHFAAAQA